MGIKKQYIAIYEIALFQYQHVLVLLVQFAKHKNNLKEIMKVKHFQTPIFQKANMPITTTSVRRLPADAQYMDININIC